MSKLTKISYVILFILLVLHPHFLTGHIFSIPRAYAQSIITLLILGIAFGLYILHKKDIQQKDNDLAISNDKLNEAFKYIGRVNHHIQLLKNLTTDLLTRYDLSKKEKKNIFMDLLANAITSIIHTNWGIFRFVDISTGNTIKEFVYTDKQYALLKTKISNKKLLESNITNDKYKKIGDLHALKTSDQNSTLQCFLIFPKGKPRLNKDLSVLQSIVDQAQLFYKYVYE